LPRDSALIQLGPGTLRSAPLGSAEPTDLTTAWDAAWIDVGYTDQGHGFAYQFSSEDVTVEEEILPVKTVPTSAVGALTLAMAQVTANNLKRAMNGGTITAGTGIVTYEPPDPSAQVRTMWGWEADDASERWVFRQCIQVGNVSIPRRKAPNKALIPVEFRLEKPSGSTKPFKAIFSTARTGT
jgi:hypothetical protein